MPECNALREKRLDYQKGYYRRHVKKAPRVFVPGSLEWNPRISEHDEHYDTIHEYRKFFTGKSKNTRGQRMAILNIPSSDADFEVEYTYAPGSEGAAYDKHGDPGDAPEGEEIEIVSVRQINLDGSIAPDCLSTLSEDDKDALEEQISSIENEDDEPEEDLDDDLDFLDEEDDDEIDRGIDDEEDE